MESFDNFEIIGKKNFEREIGKRSENLATLPNGKKKISWERVVPDKEELVEEQAGAGGEEDQEQVDLLIDHQHTQNHRCLVVFLYRYPGFKYQGGVRQASFEAPEQQKPQVTVLII